MRLPPLLSDCPAPPPARHGIVLITGLIVLLGAAIAASGGGSFASFLDLRSAIIVVGGTAIAVLLSSPRGELRAAVIAVCRPPAASDPAAMAETLMAIARRARHGGLLGLQERLADPTLPPYLRRGLGFAVDGTAEDEADTLLRLEAHSAAERDRQPAQLLRRAADYAPAMGLIGTLIGLVQMLGRLDDPAALGPSLAVALLTTFYGAVLANLVLNPLAANLERRAAAEAQIRTMIRFAILLIIRRDNPSRLQMLLNSLLPADRPLPSAGEG